MAKWLRNLGKWTKKNAGTIAKVALPVVGFAAGLVAPGVGATIGKLADKLGNKVSGMTGIGDGKPGILGIGDGQPGILGIGTGKGILKNLKKAAIDKIESLQTKVEAGGELTATETAELAVAKRQAGDDMKKDGINPLFLLGGALLGLFALNRK